jgi:hypothetical protein
MLNQLNLYLQIIEKASFVLGAILYLIFALVVVKQVGSMTKNVFDKFNSILVAFSYLHIAFAVFLVFLTIIVL